MKTKSLLTYLLILIGLFASTGGSYILARLLPTPGLPARPDQPPLTRLDLPPQTQNGYTATVQSFYADASRLVFQVFVTGGQGIVGNVNLYDENGDFVNASTGWGPAGETDLSLSRIEFDTVVPLPGDHFKGQLAFAVVASSGDMETLADFRFNLDIPIYPAQTFTPKQAVTANGVEILLDHLVITPAYTQAYLCYIKPTPADWMIGSDATLSVNGQTVSLNNYSLLYDASLADGGKGGEPGWTPPVKDGRCVKVGFPVGAKDPHSFVLTILNLEQSTPEVIPPEDVAAAIKALKPQGIEMTYESVSHGNTWAFQKLPPNMTEQQAYYRFLEQLGYFHAGPWVFHVQLATSESPEPVFSTSSYGAPTPLALPKAPDAATVPGRIRAFALSPDGKTLALATSQGLILWDVDQKNVRVLNERENFFSVDWSLDGKKLAAGGLIMQNGEVGQPHLVAWDTATWKVSFEPELRTDMTDTLYGDVAWSPDGRYLATSNGYMGVTTFDVKAGKIISEQDIFSGAVSEISWSPDGSRLVATGDMAYAIRRWKVSTDEWVRLFDPRASTSIAVAWSPDGQRIASGHVGGMICLWTAETNKCDGFIYAHQTATFSLAWSPDGRQLATGGGVIRLWDTQTGLQRSAFGWNPKAIYVQFAWPAPHLLISLETGYGEATPTTVRFWDVTTGEILAEFQGASGQLWQ